MTRVTGRSDDCIDFEGDFEGETYGGEGKTLITCSDGTIFTIQYDDVRRGIWAIEVINKGLLFESLEICTDPEAEIYSDILTFKDGLKYAFASNSWERVQ